MNSLRMIRENNICLMCGSVIKGCPRTITEGSYGEYHYPFSLCSKCRDLPTENILKAYIDFRLKERRVYKFTARKCDICQKMSICQPRAVNRVPMVICKECCKHSEEKLGQRIMDIVRSADPTRLDTTRVISMSCKMYIHDPHQIQDMLCKLREHNKDY